MMEICLHFGHSLGPFIVGQTLLSAVKTVQSKLHTSKATLLCNKNNECSESIFLTILGPREELYTLRFDPALQILQSIIYSLPKAVRKNERHEIHGTYELISSRSISIIDAIDNFGNPTEFRIVASKHRKVVHLLYHGASFIFEFQNPECQELSSLQELCEVKSRLTEIRVAPQQGSKLSELWCDVPLAKRDVRHAQLPEVRFVVHKPSRVVAGIEVCCSTGCSASFNGNVSTAGVLFGDKFEDVLSTLGSPDQVYYKDKHHWNHIGMLASYRNLTRHSPLHSDISLCYPQLGLDVLLDTGRNGVAKIVLHSNAPNHYDFCSYARCFFKFSLASDGIATNSSDSSLLITPVTNWRVIGAHVEGHTQQLRKCHYSPCTNSCFPFPDTTLWSLFDQLIVETTSSGIIAKITVLAPDSSQILLTKLSENAEVSREGKTPLPLREVEQHYEMEYTEKQEYEGVLHKDIIRTSDSEDDDAFESAHSSLTSDASLQPASTGGVTERELKTRVKIKTITHKAYYGPNVNTIVNKPPSTKATSDDSESETTPDTPPECSPVNLVYEFVDEEDDLLQEQLAEGGEILYESDTLRIRAAAPDTDTPSLVMSETNETSTHSGIGEEQPSLEHDSFDLISFSEILESQKATEDISSAEPNSKVQRNEDGDIPPSLSSETADLASADPEEQSSDQDSQNGASSSPHVSAKPEDESTQKEEPAFHYKPSAWSQMTASRTMTLSQDLGLMTRSTHETNTKPRGKLSPKSSKGTASHLKSDTKNTPAKDPRKPALGRSGRLIVQRRTGSSMSTREEARQRLLGHTKSSQQRVRQKYVPKQKEEEEEEEEPSTIEESQAKTTEDSGKSEQELKSEEISPIELPPHHENHLFPPTGEPSHLPQGLSTVEQSEQIHKSPSDPSEVPPSLSPHGPLVSRDEGTYCPDKEIDGGKEHDQETISSSENGVQHQLSPTQANERHEPLGTLTTLSGSADNESGHHDSHCTAAQNLTTNNTEPPDSSKVEPQNEPLETDAGPQKAVALLYTISEEPSSLQDSLVTSVPKEQTEGSTSPTSDGIALLGAAEETSDSESPLSTSYDGAGSPRRLWTEGPFMPGFGPPSMTQDRVLLEFISCDHEDVCSRLIARKEALSQVWQSLLDPHSAHTVDDLEQLTSCDEALLPNLLVALNKHRELWDLKFTVSLLPSMKKLFLLSPKRRHLLVACETLSVVLEVHSGSLLRYKAGRLPCSSAEERFQWQVLSEGLEEVAGSVERLIPAIQHSSEAEGGREALGELQRIADSLSKIFRKLVLE